jgi:hypothetical protein
LVSDFSRGVQLSTTVAAQPCLDNGEAQINVYCQDLQNTTKEAILSPLMGGDTRSSCESWETLAAAQLPTSTLVGWDFLTTPFLSTAGNTNPGTPLAVAPSTGFSPSIIGFYDYIQVLSLTSAGIAVDTWWNLTRYPTEHHAVMCSGNWSRSFISLAISGVGMGRGMSLRTGRWFAMGMTQRGSLTSRELRIGPQQDLQMSGICWIDGNCGVFVAEKPWRMCPDV